LSFGIGQSKGRTVIMRGFAHEPKATQQTASARSTMSGRTHFGQSREASSILHLQRTIGNRAVPRLLQANAEEPEAGSTATPSTNFVRDFSRIRVDVNDPTNISPRKKVNGPAGTHEQEADRVAESIAAEVTPSGTIDPAGRGGADFSGQLAPPLRTKLENALGWSLSRVRIHTDDAAEKDAQALGARAFTRGNDIFFGAGAFKPHTRAGIRLLGHELAHVIQQTSGRAPPATIQRKEDWDFTPDDYKALVKKKMDLRFDSDSAWFPRALQDNLLTTVKFALTSTSPVRTAGVNVKDFYHGHFAVPRKQMTPSLGGKRSEFTAKSENIQGQALGGNWFDPVTPKNLAAFTKAMQETEKLATPLLEEALKIKEAAVFYHTFESSGPSMKPGSPIRNIMTPIGGTPGGFDPSGVEKDANQFRDSYLEILQFAFLVDETGVIHVTTGTTMNLSRVTGTPMQ
jgi:hypothetical protein